MRRRSFERFFAAITEKQIRRGVHRSTRELETATYRYIEPQNQSPKSFIWTKTADQILRVYQILVGELLTQDTRDAAGVR